MARAVVVIDYQNIHLTAHGVFCPKGQAAHECLIHPLHFANQVLTERRNRRLINGLGSPEIQLAGVHLFRGLPDARRQPDLNRFAQRHRVEWSSDPRVQVHYRPLRYDRDGTAREKGIDVQVALELVALAQAGEHELVILAAHDTDQIPALEYASRAEPVVADRCSVETAGWVNCKRLSDAPHTALSREAWQRSIDRKDYR